MRKKYYLPKRKVNFLNALNALNNEKVSLDLRPLVNLVNDSLKDAPDYFNYETWQTRVFDEWQNARANVNANHSIMQYTSFIMKRLNYVELTQLSTDDVINAAIETITRECLSQWGTIKVVASNLSIDKQNKIIEEIESRLKELDFLNVLYKALSRSLIYGGVGVYFDFGGNVTSLDLQKPIIIRPEFKHKLSRLKVVEPYLFNAALVNINRPLDNDYMRPSVWNVSGNGLIHSSRLYTFSIFETPDYIKPYFNFLGLSLCGFMKDKVKSADIIRQSLTDLFLRFKTEVIKSDLLLSSNANHLMQRVELMNKTKNNNGTLLLTPNEDYINNVVSLAGFDKILSQAYENVASAARLPAVKILGLTPSGFNATGEFDLKNFYDTIRGYQATTLSPLINHVIDIIAIEKGLNPNSVMFEFNPLEKANKLELSQIKATNINSILELQREGLISSETAFKELQGEGFISKGAEFNEDLLEDNFIDNLELENEEKENAPPDKA